jgi:ABC-type molybdate transport system ATPase subunit
MEHSHLIVDSNVTQKIEREYFDWAFYDNNIFELLEVCSNLTYYAKTSKFINMFPNIKRTRSQIMNHIIYI